VASLPGFQVISPINIVARSLVFGAGGAMIFVAAIVVAELVWPRLWCRSLCPTGALYGLIGRWGLFRVRIDPRTAGRSPCHLCTRRCPMGIPVMEDFSLAGRSSVVHPDCNRCGTCVDACPGTVLHMGFRAEHPRKTDAEDPLPNGCGVEAPHSR
ncbi:MAG: 4Fe-4S binding protein, partial [Planctomycetes bacterium]|nr:4Fe-4S binding protein [Planctomycetota bacterium]